MCLVVFSINQHPRYPLIIAANRDEFFERPTQAVHHWSENPDIIAGRDKVAGGTWLGITKSGRFAAVTNIRQFPMETKPLSRGQLITDFLQSSQSPINHSSQIAANVSHYSGFNLFMGAIKSNSQDNNQASPQIDLVYAHNADNKAYQPQTITNGIHGISNGLLSDQWRKVTQTQKRFLDAINKPFKREDLLEVLRHNERLEDRELPKTGAPKDFEQQLSSAFIPTFEVHGKHYGTRSQALITLNQDLKCTYYEVQLNAQQQLISEKQFVFQITPDS